MHLKLKVVKIETTELEGIPISLEIMKTFKIQIFLQLTAFEVESFKN